MIHFLLEITVENFQKCHKDFLFLTSAQDKEDRFNQRQTAMVKGNEKTVFQTRLLNLPLKSLVSREMNLIQDSRGRQIRAFQAGHSVLRETFCLFLSSRLKFSDIMNFYVHLNLYLSVDCIFFMLYSLYFKNIGFDIIS